MTWVVTVVAALFLSGCGGNSKERERIVRETEDMVDEAYQAQDYPRIIELVDSLTVSSRSSTCCPTPPSDYGRSWSTRVRK